LSGRELLDRAEFMGLSNLKLVVHWKQSKMKVSTQLIKHCLEAVNLRILFQNKIYLSDQK
jgi:hypothetical protein